ncbi:MAG: class I SAM-dependent RNA methyltransferase [Chthoniobacterales bacterium]|nr:class I SAM-dependent RNA methyltransferase [Chthoniobacterales bacterium]
MHKLVELPIHDVAFGGKGVGRGGGKVVFVPFTIDGERVSARIIREKKQLAEAELHEVIDASEHRTTPECPYFGRCGGCTYQHISYEHQLTIKANQVEQTLRRIARLDHVPMRAIVPSPAAYGYRNRVTVHAEQGIVGYYRRESHRLIDVQHCPIATPEVNAALDELRARNPRDGHYSLRAHGGPRVFAQTNDAVADAMAALVETLLPDGSELLIDAYCGAGFFTKRLAPKFRRVVGIEWDRHAVAAAQETAAPNETYVAGDVNEELQSQLSDCVPATTCVLLDPPAEGLGVNTRRTLLNWRPHTLVYVSCNPAALARDLGELAARYKIDSVTPLDMFPQTAEIEAVVALSPI